MKTQSIVLCEGFYDRDFWGGLLRYSGCIDPGLVPGTARRKAVQDPFGRTVSQGHFAFHTRSGRFIRIIPCGGKDPLADIAKDRRDARKNEGLVHLVLIVDSDTNADGSPAPPSPLKPERLEQLVRAADANAVRSAEGDWLIDNAALAVSAVRWHAADAPAAGLPNQNTLERLCCAAIHAAYPDRAAPVQNWLDNRPVPPPDDPKAHAWSYMAGWYPSAGCARFFAELWEDPRIAGELVARLKASGAWRIAEALAM